MSIVRAMLLVALLAAAASPAAADAADTTQRVSGAKAKTGRLVVQITGLPAGQQAAGVLRGPGTRLGVRAQKLVLPKARPGKYTLSLAPVRIANGVAEVKDGAKAVPSERSVAIDVAAGGQAVLRGFYGTIINPGVEALAGGVTAVSGDPENPDTVTFKGHRDVDEGSILSEPPSDELPRGLLAHVESVSYGADTTTVDVKAASVYEVAPHLDFEIPVGDEAGQELRKAAVSCTGSGLSPYRNIKDISFAGGWNTIRKLGVDLKVGMHATVRFTAEAGVNANVSVGRTCSLKKSVSINGMAGPIPVTAALEGEMKAGISAGARMSAGASARVEVGAKTEAIPPSWKPIVNFSNPRFNAHGEVFAEVTAGIGLNLKLGVGNSNVASATVGVGASLDLKARPGSCSLDANFGSFFAEGKLLGWTIQGPKTRPFFSKNLWSHPCGATGGAGDTPGAGGGVPNAGGPAPGPGPGSGGSTPGSGGSTPGSPPAGSGTTYSETTGGDTDTWTNHTNAGGTKGATIPTRTTVQVSCKAQGFKVANGNPWWYRVASSPWSNAYWASADAFYNNGATSGPLAGTPWVDPSVPDCGGGSGGPAPGSPTGHLDGASGAAGGFIQLRGWVMDPDAPRTPTSVHAYVDGPAGSGAPMAAVDAEMSRPDVATAFPGAGPDHGYNSAFGGISPGEHTVYVYGINIAGGGDNPLLGTQKVTVPHTAAGSPFGSFDSADGRVGGAARVRGWTIDPDDRVAVTDVHAYIDGPAGSGARGIDLGRAGDSRPDVANVHSGAGDKHGFDKAIDGLAPGVHTVWIYGINAAGGGENPLLGVRTIKVPGPDPIGNVESVSGAAGGFIQLSGWVMDPDAPRTPTSVHAYVDGPAGSGAPLAAVDAGMSRPDVAVAFPGAGSEHGYSSAFGGISPGEHTVYVYGINAAGGGQNPLLRTVKVTVPQTAGGSPFGNFESAEGRLGGVGQVAGWTVDPDDGSEVTNVHVYVDGPAGSGARGVDLGPAAGSRPDVATAHPGAGAGHGFDKTIDGLSPGVHTLWVYAINAIGGGENPLLGVRRIVVPEGSAPPPAVQATPAAETPLPPPPPEAEPVQCKLPKLGGRRFRDLNGLLTKANCRARFKVSRSMRCWTVRKQSPRAGTAIVASSEVTVWLRRSRC
ncbi:MAG: hypothetical protein M3340_01055 [Actinomycetota bacterium]|nr:hypothetical protein [Actinomycetota bacterium]